eukprot:CFRG3402T1
MASLGVQTWSAISLSGAERADNGLPYTPHSVNITGRFETLKNSTNTHLCDYVDLAVGEHERIFIVSEVYPTTLSDVIASGVRVPENQIQSWALQIVCGLVHLNDLGLCHRRMSPECVQLTEPYHTQEHVFEREKDENDVNENEKLTDNLKSVETSGSQTLRVNKCTSGANMSTPKYSKVKLSRYADFYLSEEGTEVAFPISHPRYMSPDLLMVQSPSPKNANACIHTITSTQASKQGHTHAETHSHGCMNEGVCRSVHRDASGNSKFDVWALGLILLELRFGAFLWQPRAEEEYDMGDSNESESASDYDSPERGWREETIDRRTGKDIHSHTKKHTAPPRRSHSVAREEDLDALFYRILSLAVDTPAVQTQSFIRQGQRGHGALDAICSSNMELITSEDGVSGLRLDGMYDLPMSDCMLDFVSLCLQVHTTDRPTPKELLSHPFLQGCCMGDQRDSNACKDSATDCKSINEEADAVESTVESDVYTLSLRDKYHFWKLTGKDVRLELERLGVIVKEPPVLVLPSHTAFSSTQRSGVKQTAGMYSDTITVLNMSDLDRRLEQAAEAANERYRQNRGMYRSILHPSDQDSDEKDGVRQLAASLFRSHIDDQPISIRQQDIDYQFHRLRLYRQLLSAYPYTRHAIVREACIDIPVVVRAKVWAALMGIDSTYRSTYSGYDKTSAHPTDRQIDVDIPRCHQYDRLLSSTDGHAKLRRLLKAFLSANPNLVYWQGMDSIFAAWLRLNFNDEALAFACANRFVEKYLHDYFLPDNSSVMQETLAVFSHLLSFHDPELAAHVHEIGFVPDLYAIPWFLTLYTHVCSFEKIYQIWDSLLVSSSSFPLCFAVAILQQFRSAILSYDFNDCILHFSDMPELNIGWCLATARQIWAETPASVTSRRHDAWEKCEDALRRRELLSLERTEHIDGVRENENDACLESHSLIHKPSAQIQVQLHWWAKPPPLSELRSNRVPQIHIDDVLKMKQYLIVDVRSDWSFQANGHWRASLHLNPALFFDLSEVLLPYQGGNIVVMTETDTNAGEQFGYKLVMRGYARVAILRGGMDCLRVEHIFPPSPISNASRLVSRNVNSNAKTHEDETYPLDTSVTMSTIGKRSGSVDGGERSGSPNKVERKRTNCRHGDKVVTGEVIKYQHTGDGVGGDILCTCSVPTTQIMTSRGGFSLPQCVHY